MQDNATLYKDWAAHYDSDLAEHGYVRVLESRMYLHGDGVLQLCFGLSEPDPQLITACVLCDDIVGRDTDTTRRGWLPSSSTGCWQDFARSLSRDLKRKPLSMWDRGRDW